MTRKQKAALAAATMLGLALLVRWRCGGRIPDHEGELRQVAQLHADGLRRGGPGQVILSARAFYAVPGSRQIRELAVEEIERASLSLIDPRGAARRLEVRWRDADGLRIGTVTLPDVPDGDYQLRAELESDLGKSDVQVALPLYAPARVHVLTDRPLYEPGNLVRFRAVVLRAHDLTPLDARPGRWLVRDPQGEVLLEEAAPAGEFGVVAGSFPLDRGAAHGTWRIQWMSNDASDEVTFTVQPFTLPRFSVAAAPEQPYYSSGDRPVVRGAVTYSSGAPVTNARIALRWSSSGDWPPPPGWLAGPAPLLPTAVVADDAGRFAVPLPEIPQDLQGVATLRAELAASDEAGDRVATATSILLSADRLKVSAVTELGDGLAEGFNNRLYLRATTPDGRVLQGASLTVKRAWLPSDVGVQAAVDEDGVAALQLDPGPAVNMIMPAPVVRAPPRPPAIERGQVEDLLGGRGAPLADQRAMDLWPAALARCAKWFDPSHDRAQVALRVAASGAIQSASAPPSPLDQCALAALRNQRLPPGAERLYAVTFAFREPDLPSLQVAVVGPLGQPSGLARELQSLVAGARDCLPGDQEGALPRALLWRLPAGARAAQLGEWIADPQGGSADAAQACLEARLRGARIAVDVPIAAEQFGLVRFALAPAPSRDERLSPRPQATTMLGYELAVTATVPSGGAGLRTTLRIAPGRVPPLRLRVTPVLARGGERVTAELLRGPDFAGQLPKKLSIRCLKHEEEQPLDGERRAVFALPEQAQGWCTVEGGGARALAYLKPRGELTVSVAAEKPSYAPGQKAQLTVRTLLGDKGGPAAVGLFGVDQSLAQLVPLPGTDEFDRLRPPVETPTPAFDSFDGQALSLGRIVGANAAAATVLRVTAAPEIAALDAVVTVNGAAPFDPHAELTDRFYPALSELYAQARAWERAARPDEKMSPKVMAQLWNKALAACKQRGEPARDAFGRSLRLHLLPPELLALTDPHAVIPGARLPEDVESWARWVAQEKP
jgi:MG2 domain